MKVNTLEAGLNSTAVMAFTRPEVTLQESVTCCSHSLGFRKRNLALDCWPLTIFNFIYDACQQRIATFACVAEVFWVNLGPWCFLFQVPFRSLRCYPRPSASSFSFCRSLRVFVNQTLSAKIRIATSMGFLAASSMLREEN